MTDQQTYLLPAGSVQDEAPHRSSTASVALMCKWILDAPAGYHSPLQVSRMRQLVAADDRGDEKEAQRLGDLISRHHAWLHEDFKRSTWIACVLARVALALVRIVANEHSSAENQLEVKLQQDFLESYGTVEQQTEVARLRGDKDLEALARWRDSVEEAEILELCLDREHVRRRLSAASRKTNLTHDLREARDWTGLNQLVDRDEFMCTLLMDYILHNSLELTSTFEPEFKLLRAQWDHLRALADDPPDPSIPPPAYSIDVPPPSPPEESILAKLGHVVGGVTGILARATGR